MMTIQTCVCGTNFTGSRTGFTVRCPGCRRQGKPAAKATRRVETCGCGKTVIAITDRGVRRPTGVTCPRGCQA